MRAPYFSPLLLLILGVCSCYAQSFPPDAKTYSEAVSSMKVISVMTETLRQECSDRLPAMKHAISEASSTWRVKNKRAIGRADAYWDALSKSDNSDPGLLDTLEARLRNTVKKLAESPAQPGVATLSDYCARYFDQLNEWRSKTPRLHRILDTEI